MRRPSLKNRLLNGECLPRHLPGLYAPAHLTVTVRFCMLSLWGEVDEDIVFDFVPLRELSEKEQAELGKIKAETDDLLMNGCQAIGPKEVRQSPISKKASRHQ